VTNVSFTVPAPGDYQLWLSTLYSPYSTGTLTLSVDNQLTNVAIRPYSGEFDGFEWAYNGSAELQAGPHTLTISNLNGYDAVSELVVVPQPVMQSEVQDLPNLLQNKQLLYLFNTASNFVDISTKSALSTTVYLPESGTYYVSDSSPAYSNNTSLSIDGRNYVFDSIVGNWTESGPVNLTQGYHTLTVVLPNHQNASLLSISSERLGTINPSTVSYSADELSNTEYTIKVNNATEPTFLALGESCDSGWSAHMNGRQLSQFCAYSFLDGYYVNQTGTFTISLTYNGGSYLLVTWCGLAVFALSLVYGAVSALHVRLIPRHRALTSWPARFLRVRISENRNHHT
jgi:hypothetical protein